MYALFVNSLVLFFNDFVVFFSLISLMTFYLSGVCVSDAVDFLALTAPFLIYV